MRQLIATLTLLWALVGAFPAAAQSTLETDLFDCRGNPDPFQRLTCFDAVVDRLQGEGGTNDNFNSGFNNTQPAPQPANQQRNPDAIAEFAGNGQFLTRVFYAPQVWQIRWQATGSMIQIFLSDELGNFVAVAGNQQGPGPGRSDPLQPGAFTLNIASDGPWALELLPVQ